MANDPQDEVDVSADDQLSDEVLGVVSGGNPTIDLGTWETSRVGDMNGQS